MKKKSYGILPGVVLALLGTLLLLGNLDILENAENFFWGLVFLIAGIYSTITYFQNKERWWLLGLSFILLFIGVAIIVDATNFIPNDLIGTILFWGLGIVFVYVGQRDEKYWWAFLLAGLVFVMGCIVLIEAFKLLEGEYLGFIFFLGLGLTFSYLWMIRTEKNKLSWTKYPAIAFFVIAFFILMVSTSSLFSELAFPLFLILMGGYLIMRSTRKKS